MFKKRRIFALICVAAMVFGLLAGCGNGQSNDSQDQEGQNDQAAGETIKIGLDYELSGGVASYGNDCVNGILLAFKEINANGGLLDGRQIEPVKVDNKSDAAEATNVATRLVEEDKVVAILGPATSGLTKAATPVVMEHQIPLISTSATADDVTVDASGAVKEFIFRICYNDSFQGNAMANYALNVLQAKKAIILIDNASDYSKGLQKNFLATFTGGGGEIVAEEAFVAKEQDFNAILTRIKGVQADVIYLPAYYEEAGLIIKQARELGITLPILGADGFDSPTLTEIAGASALNDVFFSNHYSSQDTDPLVVKFQEAYNTEYGKEPNAFNALGYDLGYFVADAIARAGSSDPVAIKDALASTVDFAGVTGTLSVDENHNPVKAITVLELVDGVQTFNQKIEP